ncbi:MAG: hypothetical protein SO441_09165 [Candidatus Limivicinus sp.]|nr:hypothetical protein [Candidatus Limivicinus sp.]
MGKSFADKLGSFAYFLITLFIIVLNIGKGFSSEGHSLYYVLPITAILLLVSYALRNRLCLPNSLDSDIYIIPVSLLLLAFQIYAVWNYYFFTGWDVYGIRMAVLARVAGEELDSWYFSMYPNNILLVCIYAHVFKLASALNLDLYTTLFSLPLLQCFLSWLAGLLLWQCGKDLGGRLCAWLSYLFFSAIVLFSPWISVPYSDGTALLFPVGIFWLYLRRPEKKALHAMRWVTLAAASYVALQIKPQAFIIFLAILLHEFVMALEKRENVKDLGKKLIFIVVGFALSAAFVQLLTGETRAQFDEEGRFGPAHFLMMGLNDQSSGGFETNAARDAADLREAGSRLKTMGLQGLLDLWRRKTERTFCDGTFGWGKSASFYMEFTPMRNNLLCGILRNFYYYDGTYFSIFESISQAVWLIVLVASLLCVSVANQNVRVIQICCIGVFFYNLLFEAGARYLLVNLTFYILLAGVGISHAMEKRVERGIFLNKANTSGGIS